MNVVFAVPVARYDRYIDQDCGGNDFVGPNTASSPNECGVLCDQTTYCIGFVFEERSRTPDNNCHLKNVCENIVDLADVHTYKRFEGLDRIFLFITKYFIVDIIGFMYSIFDISKLNAQDQLL